MNKTFIIAVLFTLTSCALNEVRTERKPSSLLSCFHLYKTLVKAKDKRVSLESSENFSDLAIGMYGSEENLTPLLKEAISSPFLQRVGLSEEYISTLEFSPSDSRDDKLALFLSKIFVEFNDVNKKNYFPDFLGAILHLEDVDTFTRKTIVDRVTESTDNQNVKDTTRVLLLDSYNTVKRENAKKMTSRVANAFHISSNDYYFSFLGKIQSPYEFRVAIKRMNNTSQMNDFTYTQLLKSPFAKRLGLEKKDLKRIKKELKGLKVATDYNVSSAIQEALPVFLLHKSINDIDFFDKELVAQPVKDQCKWGSCWTFSSTSYLEFLYKKEFNKEIELSADYTYHMHLYEEARFYVMGYHDKIREGGHYEDYRFLSKYGLIPESVWTPDPKYKKENKEEVKEKLLSLRKRLQREKTKLRTKVERDELEQRYMDIIRETIFGRNQEPPSEFEFEGTTYTPESFFKERFETLVNFFHSKRFVNPRLKNYKKDIKSPLQTISNIGSFFKHKIDFLRTDNKQKIEALKSIKKAIDNGEPILLDHKTFERGSSYVNDFEEKELVRGPYRFSTDSSTNYKTNNMSHQQVIVGYELDKNGEIASLKLLNSWGEKNGLKGYYYLDREYFLRFAKRVIFHRNFSDSAANED
ncbi:C1 family peptidase [Halobacteriovorax sp. GB3]|uniref:C1 family peptidase n=1 Tax=Halobacteriovorax sp. GB3 TaxID=2719615 RepID=UPI00235EF547|nr:C1 family peptidase [Halobacteriovorax sp. GB3]MDD0854169.1 C1 family peptidase [Halobacteriovorax sp. GB3]